MLSLHSAHLITLNHTLIPQKMKGGGAPELLQKCVHACTHTQPLSALQKVRGWKRYTTKMASDMLDYKQVIHYVCEHAKADWVERS